MSDNLILLDPGHGGHDSGAMGWGLREADLTLEHAKALKEILEMVLPVRVEMTREEDVYVDLATRKHRVLSLQPIAFISLHCNAFSDPSAHGTLTLYRDIIDEALAIPVQSNLVKELETLDRGVRKDTIYLGKRLAVLNESPEVSCILVESAFLTNEEDCKILQKPCKIALGISRGVVEWTKQRGIFS